MLVKVKVVATNATKEEVLEIDGILEVKTKEKPINNKVNEKLVSIISKRFGVPKTLVTLIKGKKDKKKLFIVLNR